MIVQTFISVHLDMSRFYIAVIMLDTAILNFWHHHYGPDFYLWFILVIATGLYSCSLV